MKKLIILGLFVSIIASFLVFDLGQYFTLDFIKSQQTSLQEFYQQNTALTILGFLGIYIVVTGASLPGAAIMTLAGGAIFGLFTGVIIVSFASSIGATLAFLVSRYLLRDSVQKKFDNNLKSINQGIDKDGAFYLFALRLVPAFPFFVINMVMGLTRLKTFTFYWASQLGMLAGTIVYVNAGTQLAQIESASGILSLDLILSFVLLATLPFIGRKVVSIIKSNKALKVYPKPAKFDTNLIVIGGGSAGLVTAYIAAAVKAKVTLIEKHKMGGDCLNTGCVPSKAIIRSAKFLSHISRSQEFGIKKAHADFDFADVMERVQSVIKKIEPHDSVERFTKLGVDVVQGEARITSPYSVEVDGKTITARNIVVATGARPFVPPIQGIDKINYYTSDNLWELREKPKKMVVLGGGPIGSELTQSFNRLGVDVTQVEMAPRLMGREDPEISELVLQKFTNEGVNVLVNHRAKKVIVKNGVNILVAEHEGEEIEIPFDTLLVAVGRAPNTAGFGLEELGVRLSSNGTIEVDEYLQTSIPTIYACGDVAGPYQFTHTAAHQAWYTSVNSLFGIARRFKVDYSIIPWATFIEPEVGRVGLNETEAKEQNIEYEVTTYNIDDLDRAIADSEAHGFIKVLTVPGKDKILGVTIVGEHAGDLIAEYVLAMKHGLGLNKILGTIHIYPTLAESNKFAAGEWKRAHAPVKILNWVTKFHQWRRS
ncbi:MAG: FAD-dependent oxidoreductase [Gammaproteobacteria bacterium]|jgi:dihydrolipoamide dehydrogenase|nr:FAD-dependent oxidoreductase [Gammaproteobacteria bacterium]MBT3725830.1 FAD-dependent oxidoreductase [Gammaproteobacteria bacterium]MBT4195709.1 FAD-dependent oxidoreductase [Gammaproteobacteria bacterium]MBT4450786.1 FAD-dependent oxidoreductase [Gammaproteobacteria bacterium]MBT4860490.1 FAD-dependent oxidoreductase [Gammaproteobacteria bacterium]